MTRAFVALALASAVLTVPAVGGANGASRAPTVALVRMAPLQVSGSGFGSHASVRITVSWRARSLAQTVRASSNGAFLTSFPASLNTVSCRGTTIMAIAGNGRIAFWRPHSRSCFAIAVPVAPLP